MLFKTGCEWLARNRVWQSKKSYSNLRLWFNKSPTAPTQRKIIGSSNVAAGWDYSQTEIVGCETILLTLNPLKNIQTKLSPMESWHSLLQNEIVKGVVTPDFGNWPLERKVEFWISSVASVARFFFQFCRHHFLRPTSINFWPRTWQDVIGNFRIFSPFFFTSLSR